MPENIHPTLADLIVPTDTLKPYARNPRRGDTDTIATSLEVNGQYRPVVVNRRTSEVLAGNHTLAAALTLGWRNIAATFVDVDDEHAARIVAVDNRSNDLAAYDNDQLAQLLADLPDLDGTGYTQADLDELLAAGDPAGTGEGEGGDPDEAPPVPEQPISVHGDLWLLGSHRLLCGDATNPDDLNRVLADVGTPGIVYTDPPYGIAIVKGNGKIGSGGKFRGKIGSGKIVPTTEYLPVAGDENTDVARDAFALLLAEYPKAIHVWWGGNHYAASAGLPDSSCWLVWDKENGTNGFADCELAWTSHGGAVRLFKHMWNGMLRASERGKRVHPTQKPVALAEWAFGELDKDNSRRVVLDVFGGSGSTLIAAHVTGRSGALVEMEPAYVDVICRRYQEHTGAKPILESTGEEHDFTANP